MVYVYIERVYVYRVHGIEYMVLSRWYIVCSEGMCYQRV